MGKKESKEGNERKIGMKRKEKSTVFAFNFYIVDFLEFLVRKKHPLKELVEFFHTVFINPDIIIL